MPDFAVKTAFTATDKISPVFKRMSNSADKFGNRANNAFTKASTGASRLVSRMKSFAALGVAGGVALIAKEFLDFDKAIISASAKFPDLDRNTKQGIETFEKLGMTARQIGRDTEFSAAAAANGLNFLAMAGFNAEQSMALLPGVVNLATVAETDFAKASDIASDALGAFGLATKNSVQLAENFTRVQDVMAKTITSTNTDMETLFETIKFGAAPFTSAGQSMETFNAIAGRMASAGIKGSMAGTALRSAILRLQKPTNDVLDGLDKFGLTTEDLADPATGKLKDMVVIMKMWEEGGKKLTTVQRNAALTAIVGKNAVSGWASVMNEGVAATEELQKSLFGATGTSAKMAAVIRTSLTNKLKTLLSTVIELGFKFINAFSKQGGSAIETFTNIARGLGPIFQFMGWALSKVAKIMPLVIGYFIAYKVVMLALVVIQQAQLAIGWIKYLWLMRAPILAAVKAQGLFNLVLSLNPIGIVVLAIVALIAVVVIMIKKWDDWGAALSLVFGPIGMIIAVTKALFDNWEMIKHSFKTGGIIAGLKAIGSVIISGLLFPIQQFLELLSKIPGVGKLVASGAESIKNLRESIAAPNEEKTKAQQVRLDGNININGAPEGSTSKSKTTGFNSLVNLNMVGVNP